MHPESKIIISKGNLSNTVSHMKLLNLVAFAYFLLLTISAFVLATTGSLQEAFMRAFKKPFSEIISTTFGALAVLVVLNLILFRKKPLFLHFCFAIGVATILSATLLVIFGTCFPCFWEETVTRVDLSTTLYKSFLCPSYSIRSYNMLIVLFLLGLFLILISYKLKRILKSEVALKGTEAIPVQE